MTGSESIDTYLEGVRSQLQHLPAGGRNAILDDLRSHIDDALKSRCGEAQPTQADVDAVLAQMDPPSAFGPESTVTEPVPKPVLGTIALITSIAGLALFLFALIASIAAHAAGLLISPMVLILPVALLQLIALILGLCSRGDERGKIAIVMAAITLVVICCLS